MYTEILQSSRSFAGLEEEWEELYQHSPAANPAQTWGWLYSWWEYYGEDYELQLITARDEEGVLVGLLPLMLERKWGIGKLLFVSTGPTTYLDVVARLGWEDEICEALGRALKEMDGWQVADLQQLRPDAVAWSLFYNWDGPKTYVWQDGCPIVNIKLWDEMLSSLSKRYRNNARRTLRRLEADGVRVELAGEDRAEQAARQLVDLHRESWQGRNIGAGHLTRRFKAHLEAAARRMTARGQGAISEFWRDGEVIISDSFFFGREFIGDFLGGARQEALRRYQIDALWMWDAANVARRKDTSTVSLLRGLEPYKLRWSSRVEHTHRAILGRNLALWAPYASYRSLYARARRYVNSPDVPEWVKYAIERYRSACYDIARGASAESASQWVRDVFVRLRRS